MRREKGHMYTARRGGSEIRKEDDQRPKYFRKTQLAAPAPTHRIQAPCNSEP
jgi:hypothetical protein